jgi:GNAT superfamily N-acetyltransferase
VLIGPQRDGYQIDTDPDRIDVGLLHRWLSTDAYWATGRPRDVVQRSIAGSLNFGLYAPDGAMAAFTRAITDAATFAYLCDVYVDRAVRGSGLGTWFVGTAVDHLRGLGCRRLMLATADAHGLYAKFGFSPLAKPQEWMESRSAR